MLEFLTIMRSAPILPLLLRPAQDLLVRAGVDLTPDWVRTTLGLNGQSLHPWEAEVIRQAGAFADRLVLASNPAIQACVRMRLPADAQSREHRSVSAGDVNEPDLISRRLTRRCRATRPASWEETECWK